MKIYVEYIPTPIWYVEVVDHERMMVYRELLVVEEGGLADEDYA